MACSDCISNAKDLNALIEMVQPGGENPNLLPYSGSIELTLRCNVRCRHCYILYPGATDGEMDTQQAKAVLQKLADGGCIFLLMTGGEILARPDFKELYLHAKQLGMLLSVYTNATLVNEDIVAFWKENPPRRIEVTIYGHTEETYEKVTNTRGSFKRFRRGVELMLDAGLPVHLKMMVMKSNVHEFAQVRDWVHNLTGDFLFDKDITPMLDGSTEVLKERISPEQYVLLDQEAPDFSQEYRAKADAVALTTQGDELFTCGAGIRTFHVDPTGTLHSCMLWRETGYDLLHHDLSGWAEHLQAAQRSRTTTAIGCNSCSSRDHCGRCSAAASLEMGDAGSSIPYHCEITQERKRVFGEPNRLTLEIV